MAACEKCWRDSGGDPDLYRDLIEQRKDNPCSPEDQAGEDAKLCPMCGRKAVHVHCHVCMACGRIAKDYKSELRSTNTKENMNGTQTITS